MFLNRALNIRNKYAFIHPFNAVHIAPPLIENITKKMVVFNPPQPLFFKRNNYTFPINNNKSNNPDDKRPCYLVAVVVFVVSSYAFYYFLKKK